MQDREQMDSVEGRGRYRDAEGSPRRKPRTHHRQTEREMAGPQVIARIPRVSRVEEGRPAEEALGDRFGRLVGVRLSGWVLAGGAALLVVAAVSASLVSQISSSKDDADSKKQSTALRPESPAPDTSTMPRLSGTSTTIDGNQGGTTLGATPTRSGGPLNPYAMSEGQGNPPASERTPGWRGQASSNATPFAPAAVPWQAPPGPRRADPMRDPSAGDPPVAAVDPGTVYRSPRVGGLVNAVPPGARDPQATEPPPEYRTATRTRYADDPRDATLSDRSMAYPGAMLANPYVTSEATAPEGRRDAGPASGYRDGQAVPNYRDSQTAPDYRDGQTAPNYRDNGPASGYPVRGPSAGYDPAYPARSPASAYEPGYANRSPAPGDAWKYADRGASMGSETAPSADRRAGSGTWSGSPAAAASPTWSPAQTGYPAGTSSRAYPTTSASSYPASSYQASSYPATGSAAPESWPSRSYGTEPATGMAVQGADYEAAQFDGTIEKPTARTSYERTRPSIR